MERVKYKLSPHMIAWLFHRLSGIAIVLYLILHVWGLKALAQGPEQFNHLIAKYHLPAFKIGEILLLAACAYHAFNGFRIVLVDLLGWSNKQKKMWFVAAGLALLIVIVGGYPSLMAIVG